ncbi:MAG: RDD family protein [Candidatus Hadarchaeum sp.]
MPYCIQCSQAYELGTPACLKCGSQLTTADQADVFSLVPRELPNPKLRRLVAGMVDLGVVLALVSALFVSRRMAVAVLIRRRFALLVPSMYVLLKDAVGGKSVGKLFTGVVVVNAENGKPAGILESLIRNWPLAVPVVGWLLVLVVGIQILYGKRQRLGEGAANTIVVADSDYQRMR